MSKIATRYNVTACTSPEDLLVKCGLNWEPAIEKASYGSEKSFRASVGSDRFRAIVNPETGLALAFASPRFRPNSHIKTVNDVWPLVQAGKITPHNVSVWDGGVKLALQFRCTDLDVKVGPRSVINPLLTLVMNHGAEAADRSFFADFDFWCRNQAGLVSRVQGEGVRHSAHILTRYEELLESRIRSLREGMGERYATMKAMADKPLQLRGKELVGYFARAMALPAEAAKAVCEPVEGEVLSADGKVLKAIVGDWRTDDHGVPGTVWHAYSAVTRYTTHTEGRNEATRLNRAMLGAQDRFVRAFNEAAKLVA